MSNSKKHTIEEIHDYLMYWYDNDSWRDLNMALDSGYTLLAASIVDGAGAIDPRYSDNPSIERSIIGELKKYGKRNLNKDRKECFDSATVFIHKDTNEHAFISNGHVDYLMTKDEMLEMNYITSEEYYHE